MTQWQGVRRSASVQKKKTRLATGSRGSHWIPDRRFAPSGMTFWQSRAGSARAKASLDLAFLVDHVLAHDGIVLLHFHLVRGVLLVLVGGVEVAGTGRGDQADLVAFACHVR